MPSHSVEKLRNLLSLERYFVKTALSVILISNGFISRNFGGKWRVNFCKFYTVCRSELSKYSCILLLQSFALQCCQLCHFTQCENSRICYYLLEMIHFTGDIYENIEPQLLLPFYLSKKIHFSRQKLVLR